MSYLSASEVVIHYEEALYQVYAPLALPFAFTTQLLRNNDELQAKGVTSSRFTEYLYLLSVSNA